MANTDAPRSDTKAAEAPAHVEAADDKKRAPPPPSRMQQFVTTYSTFLSSFVIGFAGLVATAVYQREQQAIARNQGEAQLKISALNADNQWRIERAEILAKNLDLLSSSREETADKRYGVLLSLTRGRILDSELAVSYALDLGVRRPDSMRSVLLNVTDKSYALIDRNYVPTCEERYGVARDLPLCQGDRYAARSLALGELVADELAAGNRKSLELLSDEHAVQLALRRRSGLFTSYLLGLYERRQIDEIERFEAYSPGAHLVSALVLSSDRQSDMLMSEDEAAERERFHAVRQRWIEGYLLDKRCDPQCKGRLADLMLTDLGRGNATHEHALVALFERTDSESTHAMSRFHDRLLWCRVPSLALDRLRSRVLLPVAQRALGHDDAVHQERLKDVVGLMALLMPPEAGPERMQWFSILDVVRQAGGGPWKNYVDRRSNAYDERHRSLPAVLQGNFCSAVGTSVLPLDAEEEGG